MSTTIQNVELPDLIAVFCDDYFTFNSITIERQRQHRLFLRRYQQWCHKHNYPVEAAGANEIRDFMTDMVRIGRHVNTVRWYLGMLQPFYRWLRQRGYVPVEQWIGIQELDPPRGAVAYGKPRPYKPTEVQAIFRRLDERYPRLEGDRQKFIRRYEKGTSRYGRVWHHGLNIQLRAILALPLYLGLRRNEVFTLTEIDAHPDNAYVVVRGKRHDQNEKIREVPYTDAARETMAEWFRWRAFVSKCSGWDLPEQTIWLNLHPRWAMRPMSFTQYTALIHRLGCEFHRLRHTCATERLRAGVPIERLMELLGHATLQQTLVYAQIVRDDVQRAVARSDRMFMRRVGRPGDPVTDLIPEDVEILGDAA